MGGQRDPDTEIESADTVASDLTSTADTIAAPAADTIPASADTIRTDGPGDDLGELFDVPADHYAIGGELARGGMGRIFKARDRRAGRQVAVKEVRAELLERYPDHQRSAVLRRFEREARITARLQHPGIVPVYEIGRFGDNPFYAMKMVSGKPLDRVIRGARTFEERLALLPTVTGVAEALAYAHEKRVIHRDLKPGNILVGSFGETVVIDWGLAKDLTRDDDEELPDAGPYRGGAELETMAGTVLGTPHYMPPEQAAGETVDARADVYALGAILYHMLSGKPPYTASSDSRNPLEQILTAVLEAPPPPIRVRVPEVPADLVSIIDRAMAREPDDRYADARELADDLSRFQTGQLVATHDYSTMELVRRWVREHKGIVATGAAFFVVLIIASTVFIKQIVDERARTAEQRDRAQANADQANAQRATAEKARDRALGLAEDRGREELIAGRPLRAAMFLSEAYRAGRRTEMLSLLLGQAMKSVDSLRGGLIVPEPLRFAKFGQDGKTILIGGTRGMVTLWRPGKDITFRKRIHNGLVVTGAISNDGTRFASAAFDPDASDYRILLWKLTPRPEPIADLGLAAKLFPRGDSVGIGSRHIRAEFSNDDKWLAVGAVGGVVVWDARTGAKTRTIESGWSDGAVLQFAPSGSLCVATASGRASVWNAATGERLRHIPASQKTTGPVHISANGKRVAIALPNRLLAHDLDSGAKVAGIPLTGESRGLRLSGDGRYATVIVGDRAEVYQLDGGARLHKLDGVRDGAVMRSEHRDQLVLIRTIRQGAISVDDLRSSVQTHSIEMGLRGNWNTDIHPDGRRAMAVQPDRVFVWSTDQSTARIYDVAVKRLGLKVRLSPKGSLMITGGKRGGWLWRTRSAAKLAELGPGEIEVRGDDARVLVYGAKTTLWDTAQAKPLAQLATDHPVVAAQFSTNHRHLVTVDAKGNARQWSGDNGASVRAIEGDTVSQGRFGPSGALLLLRSNGTLAVLDPATGKTTTSLRTGSPITAFATGPERVVTVHGDGTAEVWKLSDGSRVFSLRAAKKLAKVTMSADEAVIATRTRADTVVVWDGRTGRQLQTLDWAGDPQIVGDGSLILIGANPDDEGDGPSLWNARTGALVDDFGSSRGGEMSVFENVTVVPGGRWLVAGRQRQLIDANSGRRLMGVGAESRGKWFPDGQRFYLIGSADSTKSDTAIVERPFPRERRTPDQIHQLLRARSPWVVEDGRLVPKPRSKAP